ncbi:hypothetical protein P0Y35_18695 [Kiritimatiellaeota bacterium B1221]|nr:hypothetical protein [Kiritimatiellaeota bacterium B1221]
MKIKNIILIILTLSQMSYASDEKTKRNLVEWLAFRSFLQSIKLYELEDNEKIKIGIINENIHIAFGIYISEIRNNEESSPLIKEALKRFHIEVLEIKDYDFSSIFNDPLGWGKEGPPRSKLNDDIFNFQTRNEYLELVKEFNIFLNTEQ